MEFLRGTGDGGGEFEVFGGVLPVGVFEVAPVLLGWRDVAREFEAAVEWNDGLNEVAHELDVGIFCGSHVGAVARGFVE